MPKGFRLDWKGANVQRSVAKATAGALNETANAIVGTARERAAREAHATGEYMRSIKVSRRAKPSNPNVRIEAGVRHAAPIEADKKLLFGARRKHFHLPGLAKLIRRGKG